MAAARRAQRATQHQEEAWDDQGEWYEEPVKDDVGVEEFAEEEYAHAVLQEYAQPYEEVGEEAAEAGEAEAGEDVIEVGEEAVEAGEEEADASDSVQWAADSVDAEANDDELLNGDALPEEEQLLNGDAWPEDEEVDQPAEDQAAEDEQWPEEVEEWAFDEDGLAPAEEAGEELPQEGVVEEEFGYDETIGLEGFDEEAFPDELAEDAPLPEVEGEEEEEEQPIMEEETREGDLNLEDVSEDHREAVEHNLQLKRALSGVVALPATKRRRTETGSKDMPSVAPAASAMVRQWNLSSDSAVKYVMRSFTSEEIDQLRRTRFKPDPRHAKRSCAEQVADAVIRIRERATPHAGPLDSIGAFRHRWKLNVKADEQLRALGHVALKHVLAEYDGVRDFNELVDEARAKEEEEAEAEESHALPDGSHAVSRANRLELLEPTGDALVLGDANLTFSKQLAQHRMALGQEGRTVATTFEKVDTLRERYKEINDTVTTLEEMGVEVLHGVDCTRLAVDPRFLGMQGKFGSVYYNFPHAGVVQGFFDGHPFVRWRHVNLMRLFFRALRGFVAPGGSVKVASNRGATGVRYSDIIGGASDSEFVHVETFPFTEWQLRDYWRSFGDRRDAHRRPDAGQVYTDQRAHSDMVYCFRYMPSGEAVPKVSVYYPPTKEELLKTRDAPLGRMPTESPAKKRRVEELYELFMSYVQGIHVG